MILHTASDGTSALVGPAPTATSRLVVPTG